MKLLCLFSVLFYLGCSTAMKTNLPVVEKVDLQAYMGKWYEIARYPNSFQKGCLDSRATYTLKPDGKVAVLNECERDKNTSQANGTARVVEPATNAKLKVSFFWPFEGDYWIVDLGRNYEYSVVSEPSRKYLWILSRTPELPKETLADIEKRLVDLGFDISKLLYNNHK